MKIERLHIGLIIGILMIFGSFLFCGRAMGVYIIMLLLGLGICLITYGSILLSKTSVKSKLIWTAFVIVMAAINLYTSPYLVKGSHLIYLSSNKNDLMQIVSILENRDGEISIINNKIITTKTIFSEDEKNQLKKLLINTDSYVVFKNENGIQIGIWGFLDVRYGIYYLSEGKEPSRHLSKLKSNWYYIANNE